MTVMDKDISLIDDWVDLQQEINVLEAQLNSLTQKMMQLSNALYAKKSKEELEELRNYLANELKTLNKNADQEKKNCLSFLHSLIEHDINLDTLVEQEIDIKERDIKIDLDDYNKGTE
jgi:cell division septum initiation protein DivIVA